MAATAYIQSISQYASQSVVNQSVSPSGENTSYLQLYMHTSSIWCSRINFIFFSYRFSINSYITVADGLKESEQARDRDTSVTTYFMLQENKITQAANQRVH